MEDFLKNVAGLDLYAVAHMSPDALRATLLEYRADAIALVENTAPQLVEITMDGGLIQSLKAPRGVNVTVRDYDVEGTSEETKTDERGDEFIEFGWEGNGEWQ